MYKTSANKEEATKHLFSKQIELMFGQTPKAIVGGLLSCFLFAAILWNTIDPIFILSWLFVVVVTLTLRGFLNISFNKYCSDDTNLFRWGQAYLLLTCIYGVTIGSASFVFHLTDEISYHFLVIAWFVGYIALGVSAYSMNYKAVLALATPIMLMLFANIAMVGGPLHLLTGTIFVVWGIMVISTMRPVNRSMLDAIKLNYELAKEIEKRVEVEHQLLELSIKDGLTGLFNRRHFDEAYARELKLAQRNNASLSIAMIDIDYFKLFNDTYGHQAGDSCLCKVSNTIDHLVNRPNDLVARYGGEEFIVLMPNTNNEQAEYLTNQMLEAIRKLNIEHKTSKVTDTSRLTISIGMATLDSNSTHSDIDLVGAADQALYQAKNCGRNQVHK